MKKILVARKAKIYAELHFAFLTSVYTKDLTKYSLNTLYGLKG